MKNSTKLPIPVSKALRKLGKDIELARRRRRIPVTLMAQRADVSEGTINRIEKGTSSTSIGAYISILFVLGMLERVYDLVDSSKDTLGISLESENLPKRIRIPK